MWGKRGNRLGIRTKNERLPELLSSEYKDSVTREMIVLVPAS